MKIDDLIYIIGKQQIDIAFLQQELKSLQLYKLNQEKKVAETDGSIKE